MSRETYRLRNINTIIYVHDKDQAHTSTYKLINKNEVYQLINKQQVTTGAVTEEVFRHPCIDMLVKQNIFSHIREKGTKRLPKNLAIRIQLGKTSVYSDVDLEYETPEENEANKPPFFEEEKIITFIDITFTYNKKDQQVNIKTQAMNKNQQDFWGIHIPKRISRTYIPHVSNQEMKRTG